MKKLLPISILFFLLFQVIKTEAQITKTDSAKSFFVTGIHYSYQFPQLDLAVRFGNSMASGANIHYKLKNGILFGAEWSYFFSNNVKDLSSLANLKTSTGDIINQDGRYSGYKVFERGHIANIQVGKLIPLDNNKNAGILIMAKATFLQHKIKIDDVGNKTPQLNAKYLVGYDQMSSGIGYGGFVGYWFTKTHSYFNFFGGFEINYANTISRRYNFNTLQQDKTPRRDLIIGPKVGVVLPIFKRTVKEFYYD
jgi:hypothetical protein